jgi:hypothetical protein
MAERIVINTGPFITLAPMEALDAPGQLAYELICSQKVQAELEAGLMAGHPVMSLAWKHWRGEAL